MHAHALMCAFRGEGKDLSLLSVFQRGPLERGKGHLKKMQRACRNNQLSQLKLLSPRILPYALRLTCFPNSFLPHLKNPPAHIS